jgi:hypothetical protein
MKHLRKFENFSAEPAPNFSGYDKKEFEVGDSVTFQHNGETIGGVIKEIVGLNARVSSAYLTKDTSIPFRLLKKA